MKGLVHGRSWQIVHGGINDAKVFLLTRFHKHHLRQTHASIAHQRATWFNHELFVAIAARIQFGQQLLPQLVGRGGRVAVVVDAQATAKINVVDGNAGRFNVVHQVQHAVHGVEVGRYIGNLRTNVAVNAHDLQAGQCGGTLVGLKRVFMGHPKFVALQACGNIGVCLGVDVGVDAQTHRGLGLQRQSHFI